MDRLRFVARDLTPQTGARSASHSMRSMARSFDEVRGPAVRGEGVAKAVVTGVITAVSAMSMVKTLKQIGNSYGVIIDKPILEILHITPETPLEITTDGRSLQIRPVRQRKRPSLSESLDAVNRRHSSTLKKLAK